MRIGIDIDGVLYPWVQASNEAVMLKFGIEDPGDHEHWNWLKDKLTPEQWRWVWSEDAVAHVFGRSDLVYPGVVPAVQELIDRHEVHFVTHRNPERTTGWTGDWLWEHFSNYAGVHVLHNSVRKVDVLHWDVFIDDKPETVTEMLQRKVRIKKVFMPNRIYNASYVPPFDPFLGDVEKDSRLSPRILVRYDNWEEVLWEIATL